MANPQLEDGYTKIANEILNALCKIRIAGEARQMLDVIIRKTWGYNKKADRISTSQFMELTNLPHYSIWKARKKLLQLNMITITKKGDSQVLIYSIQKDYNKWKLSPKKVLSPKRQSTITKKGEGLSPKRQQNLSPKSDTQKKERQYTKETITKERFPFLVDTNFSQTFQDYLKMRIKIKRPATTRAQEIVLKKLHTYDLKTAIAMLEQSIVGSWQDVYPLKDKGGKSGQTIKKYAQPDTGKYKGISTKAE